MADGGVTVGFVLMSRPDALRQLRLRAGHSTRTLARKAQLRSHAAIVRLEGGPVPVLPDTAHRLADALGVDVLDIATFVEDQEKVS